MGRDAELAMSGYHNKRIAAAAQINGKLRPTPLLEDDTLVLIFPSIARFSSPV
jgi:hypothetical protein